MILKGFAIVGSDENIVKVGLKMVVAIFERGSDMSLVVITALVEASVIIRV
jgi:hypothetical protein